MCFVGVPTDSMKDMCTLSPSTAQASQELWPAHRSRWLAPQEPWLLEPITHGVGATGRRTPSTTATAVVMAGRLLWNRPSCDATTTPLWSCYGWAAAGGPRAAAGRPAHSARATVVVAASKLLWNRPSCDTMTTPLWSCYGCAGTSGPRAAAGRPANSVRATAAVAASKLL